MKGVWDELMDQIGRALYVGAGLFWNAFWASAFGYAFSSLIQVLVPRDVIAQYLGRKGLKETALGMFIGPASSACSFAALSAGRALLAKGAALVPMMAFLFGSTTSVHQCLHSPGSSSAGSSRWRWCSERSRSSR